MSRFNSRKMALIGLKGEKGEPGDSGVLKGAGAPTTETIGEIGKFYVDTTSGTSYQCVEVDTETSSYTWVKLIKATDIALINGDYGLVKFGDSNLGLSLYQGKLAITPAGEAYIKGQSYARIAITPANMAYGVKQALINPNKSTSLPANWTPAEQAMARVTLGILEGEGAPTTETVGTIGQFYTDTSTGTSYQCASIVDGVYTWVRLIKATDIASDTTFGIVAIETSGGLEIMSGTKKLNVRWARNYDLERKSNRAVVCPYNLGYAVKQGLIDPDNANSGVKGNWTEEDRAKARETLGITDGGGSKIYKHTISVHLVDSSTEPEFPEYEQGYVDVIVYSTNPSTNIVTPSDSYYELMIDVDNAVSLLPASNGKGWWRNVSLVSGKPSYFLDLEYWVDSICDVVTEV